MSKDIKDQLHLEDGVEAFLVGDGESLVQVGGERLRNQTQKPLNLFKYFCNKPTMVSWLPRNWQLFWIFCQKLAENVFALCVCCHFYHSPSNYIQLLSKNRIRIFGDHTMCIPMWGAVEKKNYWNYVLTSPATPSPSATVATGSTYHHDDWWSQGW